MYKGWIPTLSGKLSFENLGNVNYPTQCFTLNKLDSDGKRLLLCHQQRSGLDGIAPGFLYKLKFGVGQKIEFLLFAEETSCGELQGHIFWFLDNMKTFLRELHSFSVNELLEKKDAILHKAKNGSVFFCEIRMKLNGELTLLPMQGQPREGRIRSDRGYFKPLEQCYIFVKDLCHGHQHHPKDDDQICTIFKVDSDRDPRWIYCTEESLFKYLIAAKRKEKIIESYQSLGLLAYLEAFIKSHGFGKSSWPSLQQLRESIESKIDEIKYLKNRNDRLIPMLYMPLLSLLAVLCSFTIIFLNLHRTAVKQSVDITFDFDHNILFWGDILLSHFSLICLGGGLVIWLNYLRLQGGEAFPIKYGNFFFNMVRLALALCIENRRNLLILLCLMIIILTGLVFWLVGFLLIYNEHFNVFLFIQKFFASIIN